MNGNDRANWQLLKVRGPIKESLWTWECSWILSLLPITPCHPLSWQLGTKLSVTVVARVQEIVLVIIVDLFCLRAKMCWRCCGCKWSSPASTHWCKKFGRSHCHICQSHAAQLDISTVSSDIHLKIQQPTLGQPLGRHFPQMCGDGELDGENSQNGQERIFPNNPTCDCSFFWIPEAPVWTSHLPLTDVVLC